MSEKEKYEIWKKLYEAEGGIAYGLAVFGDHIAKREGYKSVEGMEAVRFYLVHKFSWVPSQVRAMSYEDMSFVLQEEMARFTYPKDARVN